MFPFITKKCLFFMIKPIMLSPFECIKTYIKLPFSFFQNMLDIGKLDSDSYVYKFVEYFYSFDQDAAYWSVIHFSMCFVSDHFGNCNVWCISVRLNLPKYHLFLEGFFNKLKFTSNN